VKRYLIILCSVVFSGCSTQPYSISASKVFKFGASLTEIEFQLSRKCDTLSLQQINPITAPLAKESQTQLNCSGFYYAGKKRNIELVFQDNQLDLVWILFPENEKTDILEGFSESYGEPTKVIDFGSLYLTSMPR